MTAEFRKQAGQAGKFNQIIWANLEDIGYGG